MKDHVTNKMINMNCLMCDVYVIVRKECSICQVIDKEKTVEFAFFISSQLCFGKFQI